MARQNGNTNAEGKGPRLIAEEWAASVLPRRAAGAHKWSVGGVVVVAGSPQFAGAAALCCMGASRSGAGIVTAALPRSIASLVVGLAPDVAIIVLSEGDGPSVAARSAGLIDERLQRSAAMVIGPGLGDDETTAALLGALFGVQSARGGIGFGPAGRSSSATGAEGVVASSARPVVVDADALNWLSRQDAWWERVPPGRLVLTPHVGEMARLLSQDIEHVLANPVVIARDAAAQWKQTVVLKGNPTLVASHEGVLLAAQTPASLATAGSGDVLSGSIAAFLAQGLSASDAAGLAVYVGGRAAKRVEARYGTLGVVASDLPVAIAEELKSLESVGD